nr:hypothetical protein B0A51_08199 [Rachicladosporium sp. CCFEE 5018]
MDLLQSVRKSGSRGGVNFSWDAVKTDTQRENYLGHSLMAPVGRWQKGKDLNWYAKADDADKTPEERAELARTARKEELRKVKEAEEDAMAKALGLPVPDRENANLVPIEDAVSQKKINEALREVLKDEEEDEEGAKLGLKGTDARRSRSRSRGHERERRPAEDRRREKRKHRSPNMNPNPPITPGNEWKNALRAIIVRCEETIVKSRVQNGGVADRDLEVCENAIKVVCQQEIENVLVFITTQVPASQERTTEGIRVATAKYEAALEMRRQEVERVEKERAAEQMRAEKRVFEDMLASEVQKFKDRYHPIMATNEIKLKEHDEQIERLRDEQKKSDTEHTQLSEIHQRVLADHHRITSENLLLVSEKEQLKDDYHTLVSEHQQLVDEHRLLQQHYWHSEQQLADLQLQGEME